MADLAVFFRHLVTGYRTEKPLSLDQLRLANALLQLKEGFVYLILNAQLAQWATTLHLPWNTPPGYRRHGAPYSHRRASG